MLKNGVRTQLGDGSRYSVGDVDFVFTSPRDKKRPNGREAQVQASHARDSLSSHRIRRSRDVICSHPPGLHNASNGRRGGRVFERIRVERSVNGCD